MQQLSALEKHVDSLQAALEFRHTRLGRHFQTSAGLGRMGVAGFAVGTVLGLHASCLLACLLLPTLLGWQETHTVVRILMMWSMYAVILAIFHFFEFFMTAVYQPVSLSYDSWVIAHSKAYTVAMLVSWSEFWLESVLFGSRKYSASICWAGVMLAIGGQAVRIVGMRTCGQSFSHIIVTERPPDHELITHGIYRYLRHPAYFGWFYWSIATQLILCNPISAMAFGGWAWYFFSTRIPYEESLLHKFYGEKYADYCKHSNVGIPFISSGISPADAVKEGVSPPREDKVFNH